jgi:hypothetical protein
MRCCVGAAIVAALACCGDRVALAEPSVDGFGATALLFSGADLWRNGGFLHGGVIWSPGGLDRDGFTFKAMLSGGTYRYLSGALGNTEVEGREGVAQLMPGWRFITGRTEIKVFGGLDLQTHKLTPDDPSSRLRGGDAGARAAFEIWSNVSANMILAANGSASTIAGSYDLRGAAGWRLFERFYTGPEVQMFASGDYQQYRVGLHVTSVRLWEAEWSAAAGWARDSDERQGAYVRVGVSLRR